MNDIQLMRLAITEAKKSKEPTKCGVVIAKDGAVIAKTYNSQREDCNASSHAEIKALGVAGKTVGNKDLIGCDVYCTCEPCAMCTIALVFAKVKKIYTGSSMTKTTKNNFDIGFEKIIKDAPIRIETKTSFMEAECDGLLDIK
ncbi:MAG: nucleoside deaminase [Candidatus Shapirobacteria bacterium]|jgi:tRNA(Arg) A34 adenosine deaminase TadA